MGISGWQLPTKAPLLGRDGGSSTRHHSGLNHIGLPISSDAIESLFGVAKQHGVGETWDAARIALRLPAFCGLPTREKAEQVLDVSVPRQQAFTAQHGSLTKQRREVLGHPERLESLSLTQAASQVELIAESQKPVKYSTYRPDIKWLGCGRRIHILDMTPLEVTLETGTYPGNEEGLGNEERKEILTTPSFNGISVNFFSSSLNSSPTKSRATPMRG
jgi:hypothetical protein